MDLKLWTELSELATSLPPAQQEKYLELTRQVSEEQERICKSVKQLKDSVDYMRLSVKYLIFDLEATRRENASLSQLLEDTEEELED